MLLDWPGANGVQTCVIDEVAIRYVNDRPRHPQEALYTV